MEVTTVRDGLAPCLAIRRSAASRVKVLKKASIASGIASRLGDLWLAAHSA